MEVCIEVPAVEIKKIVINPCPCCSSDNLDLRVKDTGNGCDRFTGYAAIECMDCHHILKKESSNIGYGDTLDDLRMKVIKEWNDLSATNTLKDRLLVKALAALFDSHWYRKAQISGDAIVWEGPGGRPSSILLENLEIDVDKKLKELETRERFDATLILDGNGEVHTSLKGDSIEMIDVLKDSHDFNGYIDSSKSKDSRKLTMRPCEITYQKGVTW